MDIYACVNGSSYAMWKLEYNIILRSYRDPIFVANLLFTGFINQWSEELDTGGFGVNVIKTLLTKYKSQGVCVMYAARESQQIWIS